MPEATNSKLTGAAKVCTNVKKTLSFSAILILNVALYVFVIEKIYDPRVFISLRDRTSKPGRGKGEKYELNGLRNVVKAEKPFRDSLFISPLHD